jgi:hypothetical protein
MSLRHREDSITGIRHRDALKTKVATSVKLVGGFINLELPEGGVCTGTMVKFVAPCASDKVTGGIVIDGVTYTVVDAVGNCITGKIGYWDNGAALSFLIDSGSKKAFLQNAAWMPISGGEFLGVVKAGESAQPIDQYLLRNSKLSPFTAPEKPDVDGEICWMFE